MNYIIKNMGRKMKLPNKKYNIIYADPPWNYNFKTNKSIKNNIRGCAEQHYKTMNLNELNNLSINNICNKDCILFMWATFPCIQNALDLIKGWGFKYKTVGFVWVKITKDNKPAWGCGFWTRSNVELCLIGIKGHPKRIAKNIHQVVMSPRGIHSKKPDEVKKRIVELIGDLPRIELFAREKTEGWDCWGNEIKDGLP